MENDVNFIMGEIFTKVNKRDWEFDVSWVEGLLLFIKYIT